MKLLVNHVKSQVYEELFNQLILNENKSKENIDKLLSESDEVKKRRNEANATLRALNKANEIINEIRESDYDVPEEKEEVESIDSSRGFLADIKKFIVDGAGASGAEFILWGGFDPR
uniref:GED domain-containing protein n=1 Tax=Acrobeloides nanus TaxID=290746 RepID=A0A914DTZ0_9BILA